MKWELYLTRREWEEIKAAVRQRAPQDAKTGRPCCERCQRVHGRLKRSRSGYLTPHWLHTAHLHGAPLKSKDAADYLALCDACHMWYDRQPDHAGWVPPFRRGYEVTTTDDLLRTMHGAGLSIWQEGSAWRWRIGNEEGFESSPVLAAGSAVARLARLACVECVGVG
jgi:hypothetical protein